MKSVKNLTIFVLILALFVSLLPASAAGPNGDIGLRMYDEKTKEYSDVNVSVVNLLIDGKTPDLTSSMPAVVQIVEGGDNRTLVPINAVAKALGANVLWSQVNRQAILRKGTTTIVLTLGSSNAVVNGKEVPLPGGVPACALVPQGSNTGSTMVPLRFVSEQLGAKVDWEQESYTAKITSPDKDVTYVTRIYSNYDALTILIDTDAATPDYKVVDLGDRVAVDMLGCELAAGFPGTIPVDNDYISTVRYDQHGGDLYPEYAKTVRVVLDLKKGASYAKNITVTTQGSGVLLTATRSEEEEETPPEYVPPTPLDPSKKTIVVDAGHGGYKSGAVYEGIMEKDLTLSMSKKLEAVLLNMGYNVVMTRDTDIYMDLYDRCDIANAVNADLFISIHCNATTTSKDFAGIFTYFHPSSKRGEKLAYTLQPYMAKATGAIDRGIMKDDFVVLRETKMCAVLIETGFMTNHEELMNLANPAYQDKLVKGIAEGITAYLKTLQ